MKKWMLFSSIILWIFSIPIIIVGVDKYIKDKDQRLLADFKKAIHDIFNGREYIDIVYSGRKVSYEKTAIPNRPDKMYSSKYINLLSEDKLKQIVNRWKEDYGDLTKMYRIKNNRKEWNVAYEEEDGWKLITIRSSYDANCDLLLVQQSIFPYAVGYKKQDYYLGYGYTPSVSDAVNDAFDFFTTNPKSDMFDNYEKGSYNRILGKVYDCENEYYTILRDSIPKLWELGETLWGEPRKFADNVSGGRIVSPMAYTYMHNGYYKVFIGVTQPTTWSIKRWDQVVDSERAMLLKWWLISTGVFFAIFILLLSISLYKKNKRVYETDYHKLLRLSHPRNFMKPYDKEKLEKANLIYKEVEQIKRDDMDTINSLIQKCIDDLGISFIDSTALEKLKQQVNPERFMNPYDHVKIQLANELFATLSKSDLTYAEYVDVRNRAQKL